MTGQFGIDLEAIFESLDHTFLEDIISEDPVELTQNDVLLAPLSSGTTTGVPKCVFLTHGNFNAATKSLKK